jgi:hypothetical protein
MSHATLSQKKSLESRRIDPIGNWVNFKLGDLSLVYDAFFYMLLTSSPS